MSERAFRNTVNQRQSFTLVSSTHIYRMSVSIEFRMVISQNQSRQVNYHNLLTEIFINIQIARQSSLSIRQFRASPHTHPSPRLRSRRPYRRHPRWHRNFVMHHQYQEKSIHSLILGADFYALPKFVDFLGAISLVSAVFFLLFGLDRGGNVS